MSTTGKVVILHCKIGNHEWERPSKRGRLPENCPDHTPTPSQRQQASVGAMQEGRVRKAQESRQQTIAEIIEHPRASSCRCGITPDMTDEALRKLPSCTEPYYVCGTLDSVRRAISI